MSDSIRTAAIIGGGFSGICAAIKLKKLGILGDIFDKNKGLGGTWFTNTYPGCACDIASHNYTLSFDLNPSWSKNFSGQAEILEYLYSLIKKHNLIPQAKLETEIIRTTWLEDIHKWKVEWRSMVNEEQVDTGLYDYVFSCMGLLSTPYVPKELSGFQGTVLHTARWDGSIDITNKRIAVVGSGSSAAQIIPQISKQASHLYNFQRTPAWVTQRNQFVYSDFVKKLFLYVPFFLYIYNLYHFFSGDLAYFNLSLYKTFYGGIVRRSLVQNMTEQLEKAGRPDLAALVIPNYAPGCKRIIFSNEYLGALAQSNVTLVPNAVKRVYGKTIVDANDCETEVDILILATGYNVQSFIQKPEIIGKNGKSLNDLWAKEFPKTYKTVNVNGFPNLFFLFGPSSATGHTSVLAMVECQMDLAFRNIQYMINNGLTSIEPSLDAQEKFSNDILSRLKNSVWSSGCRSWYQNDSGELFTVWPKAAISFWWSLKTAKTSDYYWGRSSNKVVT
ncbi:hypothetical protein BDF14DRAFT_1864479 [Spinellus fusiger]|nr:hypothetical protein BDF14DRAFT_1864479 [Spinellus fusiger]